MSTAVRATVTGLLRRLGSVVAITEPQQDTAASSLGSGAAFLAAWKGLATPGGITEAGLARLQTAGAADILS